MVVQSLIFSNRHVYSFELRCGNKSSKDIPAVKGNTD